MKIFKRILNRWGYRGLLPIYYLVLFLGLIGSYLICALPLILRGEKLMDYSQVFPYRSACGEVFDILVPLAIFVLSLPGYALTFPFWLLRHPLEGTAFEFLLQYLEYLGFLLIWLVNLLIVFLIGVLLDKRQERRSRSGCE